MNRPTKLNTVRVDGRIEAAGVGDAEAFEAQAKFGPRVTVRPFTEPDRMTERVHETLTKIERGLATESDAVFLDRAFSVLRFALDEETNGFGEWDSMEGRQEFLMLCTESEWGEEI